MTATLVAQHEDAARESPSSGTVMSHQSTGFNGILGAPPSGPISKAKGDATR